ARVGIDDPEVRALRSTRIERHLDPARVGGPQRVPNRATERKLVRAWCNLRLNVRLRRQVDDVYARIWHHRIARQRVRLRVVLGTLRRIRDVVHVLNTTLVLSHHGKLFRVGRPADLRAHWLRTLQLARARRRDTVGVELDAVSGELHGVFFRLGVT